MTDHASAPQPPAAAPSPRTLFVGGGNMASAMIAGLLAGGIDAATIHVIEPNAAVRDALVARHRVGADPEPPPAGRFDAVVLAVKPQQAAIALNACRPLLASNPDAVLISIAAGLRCETIARESGGHPVIVRAMPNTPALIGEGATGLFLPAGIGAGQAALARAVLQSTGLVVPIAHEGLLDAVTAVSGSGPAYVFLLIESMIEAAIANGLDAATARTLVLATVRGAARLAEGSDESAEVLRRRVTSPGGTTAAAIAVMERAGLKATIGDAITAARERGEALGRG
ncbi:MAG: pyrroline-5-carboxylate reductase [Lautropia sp.]